MHFNILLGFGLLAADSALAAPKSKWSTITEYKTELVPNTLVILGTANSTVHANTRHTNIGSAAKDKDEPAVTALETSTVVVTDTKTKHVTKTASVNTTNSVFVTETDLTTRTETNYAVKTLTANATQTTVTTDVALIMAVVSTTDTNTAWTTATVSVNATATVASDTVFLIGTSSTTETELVTATETVYVVNTVVETATAEPALETDEPYLEDIHQLYEEDSVSTTGFDDPARKSAIASITKTALADDDDAPSATKTRSTAIKNSDPPTTSEFSKHKGLLGDVGDNDEEEDEEEDDDTTLASTETEAETTEETDLLATSDDTEEDDLIEEDTTSTEESDPLLASHSTEDGTRGRKILIGYQTQPNQRRNERWGNDWPLFPGDAKRST
ncbi:hypothetical protein NW762_001791 [Fusarium torreyae]|uniref:Uncharacterized protein n=1 Tax=Fusarium torreyae TaxID=1237075 RepID=A0A9W8SEH9_9HYPO|nr:hypothetical protein NW762_001791 [Fusarium torreyae]